MCEATSRAMPVSSTCTGCKFCRMISIESFIVNSYYWIDGYPANASIIFNVKTTFVKFFDFSESCW